MVIVVIVGLTAEEPAPGVVAVDVARVGQGDDRPADTRACGGHVTGFELVGRCDGCQRREEECGGGNDMHRDCCSG